MEGCEGEIVREKKGERGGGLCREAGNGSVGWNVCAV